MSLKKTWQWVAVLIAVALWGTALIVPARANGAPVKVFLSYLPGVSNWGPQDATGVAVVSIGEATVHISAAGLPRLSGEIYEGWLVDSESDAMVSVGRFNADEDGKLLYEVEFEQLPYWDYRYVVLSVEPDPDTDLAPTDKWAIAGVFPNLSLKLVSDTPTPETPAVVGTPYPTPPPAPGYLPETGAAEGSLAWAVTWALVAGGSALLLGGRTKHRKQ